MRRVRSAKSREVLIEADHGDMYVGYTREYVKALCLSDKPLETGSVAKVTATGNMYSALICKII